MRMWVQLAVLTVLGIAIRLVLVPAAGHVVDMNAFADWAVRAANAPWNQVYEATNANYPPASMLFFEAAGRLYAAIHPAVDPDQHLLKELLKLPNVFFDALGGLVVYALARRFATHRPALGAAALYALNPAIIYDSAYWGQNDSITTVSALAALTFAVWDLRVPAWLAIGFAILTKPQVIVLAPLLAIEPFTAPNPAERTRRLRGSAIGIVLTAVLGYALTASFYTQTAPLAVIERLINWTLIGASLYPYTSANAFNIYAFLPQFFRSDTGVVLFFSVKTWAWIAFGAIAVVLYANYARVRDRAALIESAFLLMLSFFLVLTEMHERYLMFALTFVPALSVIDRRYLWSTIALTLTEWLNLEYSLNYMWIESDKPAGIDPYAFSPVLARLCALTNIAVFVTGIARLFTRESEPADPNPGSMSLPNHA